MVSADNDGVQLTKTKKFVLADLQIVRYGDIFNVNNMSVWRMEITPSENHKIQYQVNR